MQSYGLKVFDSKYFLIMLAMLIVSIGVCYACSNVANSAEGVNNPTIGGRQDSSEMLSGWSWAKPKQSSVAVTQVDKESLANAGLAGGSVVNAEKPPVVAK